MHLVAIQTQLEIKGYSAYLAVVQQYPLPKSVMNEAFSVQLCPAKPDDVQLILQLIHELAEFEHLRDEVTATEAQLTQHLFGAHPYAEVLLAFVNGEAAGFALFFHNYSTFVGKPGIYLEDLYVRDRFRAQGVGTTLLKAIGQLAVSRDCGRFEWSVLNWNKRAIDFYEKMGARPLSEWTVYRIKGESLLKLNDG